MFNNTYDNNSELPLEELKKEFEEYKRFLINLCYVLNNNNITINFQRDDSDTEYGKNW